MGRRATALERARDRIVSSCRMTASKAALQRSGLALAATDDVSTGPLVRSSEAVKYQVAGSMQIRYVCARNQSKYFTCSLTNFAPINDLSRF